MVSPKIIDPNGDEFKVTILDSKTINEFSEITVKKLDDGVVIKLKILEEMHIP
jgi:hypothetical protein